MAFVSLAFLGFILLTAVIYFIAPLKYRWIVLLTASYVYFWLNSKWLVLVLFASTLITFADALWISSINRKGKELLKKNKSELSSAEKKELKDKTKKKSRLALLPGIAADLGMLLFLKYFNFFAQNVNPLLSRLHLQLPVLHLLLPLGISFYTLQAIGYLTDVYRGKIEPNRNLPKFMLFMSFFPQIVQGPIPRYRQLAEQLYEGHCFDYDRFVRGTLLILWGFMKKMLIADRISIPTDQIFNNPGSYNGGLVFLGAAMYGLQVYTDFSGGMDIACGVSEIFGIRLEKNFRQPYFSKSIEEFWRRWHITLGAWMRDYIFYPLSLSKAFGRLSKRARKIFGDYFGNRVSPFIAMFIVYFLVGFWHGANWKYIIYGIWNGLFIVTGILFNEKYDLLRSKLKISSSSISWRTFQIIRTFTICSIGRFFSRAADLPSAITLIRSMFVQWYDLSYIVDGSLVNLGLDTANWIFLAIAILILFGVDYLHEKDVSVREVVLRQSIIFRWAIILGAIFLLLVFGIYGPGYDSASFIYAQF